MHKLAHRIQIYTMKNIPILLLSYFVFTLMLNTSVNAQDKYAKTGSGYGTREILDFDAAQYSMLKITNQHGNITINGWDSDSIQIQTLINVQAPGSNSAEEVLDFISIQRASRGGMLIFRTAFDEEFFSNYPFSIDYTINVPKSLMLDINNNLGDVLIQNVDGKIKLHLDYGKLHLVQSNNKLDHDFTLNFADAKLDTCNNIKGKLNNTTFTADKVGRIEFKSQYSAYQIGEARSISLNSATDKININQSDSLQVSGNQLLINVKKLNTFGFVEVDRGQLMLKADSTLSKLSISNKMANTIITLPVDYTYLVNGEITNGELIHPNPEQLQLVKEGSKESFSGKIGTTNTYQGQLVLFNKNSDLTIKTY